MDPQLSSTFGAVAAPPPQAGSPSFFLVFRSLFQSGRGFAFACDPQGQVDMDGMRERERNNYLYARAMVGREVDFPSVHAHVERIGTRVAPTRGAAVRLPAEHPGFASAACTPDMGVVDVAISEIAA